MSTEEIEQNEHQQFSQPHGKNDRISQELHKKSEEIERQDDQPNQYDSSIHQNNEIIPNQDINSINNTYQNQGNDLYENQASQHDQNIEEPRDDNNINGHFYKEQHEFIEKKQSVTVPLSYTEKISQRIQDYIKKTGNPKEDLKLAKEQIIKQFKENYIYQYTINTREEKHMKENVQQVDSKEHSYIGFLKNNQFHGKGMIEYKEQDRYDQNAYNVIDIYLGDFKNGQMHGYGIYINANGERYEGTFIHGEKLGTGKFYYMNGDVYDGCYRSIPEGSGTKTYYLTHEKYEGIFNNGQRHGRGKQYYSDGSLKYDGQFVCDQIQNHLKKLELQTEQTPQSSACNIF